MGAQGRVFFFKKKKKNLTLKTFRERKSDINVRRSNIFRERNNEEWHKISGE